MTAAEGARDEARARDLSHVVGAAQRVAGLAAARSRGDRRGADQLLATFDDPQELAAGALLVAELALTLLGDERNVHVDLCAQQLCADLEAAVHG